MQTGKSCDAYRGTPHRGVSRACYAAIWAAHCQTEFWKDNWRNDKRLHTYTYDELVTDTKNNFPFRCYPHGDVDNLCSRLTYWLSWTATLVHTGFLPEFTGMSGFIDEEVVDIADITRGHCALIHTALRFMIQAVPEAFTNRSRILARRRFLHLGVAIEAIKKPFYVYRPQDLLRSGRGLFATMRAISEAPFSRQLRKRGFDGMDDCARVGFLNRLCIRGNASLLAAFYRHRDPGLPPDTIAELIAQQEPTLRASGYLAKADRQRNLGEDIAVPIQAAFTVIREEIFGLGWPLEALFPKEGPPTHLLWHFLDKLSLPLHVPLQVDIPPLLEQEGAPPSKIPTVEMSVLPDRDIISDTIRRTLEFHCPAAFKNVAWQAVRDARRGSSVLRVVEVGGFLGDCLLWMAAWVGPEHLQALEVEPVAAATARLRKTLSKAQWQNSITIATEALGDGGKDGAQEAVCSHSKAVGGAAPANPNFAVDLLSRDHATERKTSRSCRYRSLDEILAEWSILDAGSQLDMVRIKAAGSEARIVAGLEKHLEAKRVRHLLVQCAGPQAEVIFQRMSSMPWYSFQGKEGHAFSGGNVLYYSLRQD
eukprot:TRINITY_DN37967_c0_g1_i2.p1 TRINITY_DN37967_c0_g1~~TRINITY_DN37967_c0_g1_i2.p1  ORF type:complete len:592 (-),score=103.79 TRINITY_DN37967_c0_g1_i2:130-1905(-)